jgi:hypothetical protein
VVSKLFRENLRVPFEYDRPFDPHMYPPTLVCSICKYRENIFLLTTPHISDREYDPG